MKLKHKILITFSLALIVGLIILGNFGGRLIIQINQDMYNNIKGIGKNVPTPSDYGLQSEYIYYTSADKLKLSAVLVKTDTLPQKGTVLLIHGIRSGKEHYLPASKLLADNGYNSVLVDLRAHGQSEGKYCTFGFREKQDVVVLIDSLSLRTDIRNNFGIWGNSLGAAVSLQSMAIDNRIKFGIIESTFADFRTVVHEYSEGTIGINISILNDYAIWWAEMIGHFNADQVKPTEVVKQITQPVIMVHGSADNNINIKYGKQNFEHLASKNKQFIEVPNAHHGNVWNVGGEEYFKQVVDFIDSVSQDKMNTKQASL